MGTVSSLTRYRSRYFSWERLAIDVMKSEDGVGDDTGKGEDGDVFQFLTRGKVRSLVLMSATYQGSSSDEPLSRVTITTKL